MLDEATYEVRDAAFCVNGRGYLLRTKSWAYIQYGNNGLAGEELFDMQKDPKQYTNLANHADFAEIVELFRKKMDVKLNKVFENDLGLTYELKRQGLKESVDV